jgi:NAD(P)H-dependent FMN reductase
MENEEGGRPLLGVVIASTRPGRVGPAVATWFLGEVERHGRFAADRIDLAEVALPFLDEPNHPRARNYTKEHTRRWSRRVDALDALAFVVPEYNYAMAAPLKNALDYLHWEWQYKPAAFVSYGGVSAGTRGVQMAKEVVTTLKLVPLPEAVSIPFVGQFLDDEGNLTPNKTMEDAAQAVLDELARWEQALRGLRSGSRAPAAVR